MKQPADMSRAELLAALRKERASADAAWAIAASLVEKIAKLEKELSACSSKDVKSST